MGGLSTAYSVFFLLMVIPLEIFLSVIFYSQFITQNKNWVELEIFFLSLLRKSVIISILVGIPISAVVGFFNKMAYELGYEVPHISIFLIFLLSLIIVYLVYKRELNKGNERKMVKA